MKNITEDTLQRLSKFKLLIENLEKDINSENHPTRLAAFNIAGGLFYLSEIMSKELDNIKPGESLVKKLITRFSNFNYFH